MRFTSSELALYEAKRREGSITPTERQKRALEAQNASEKGFHDQIIGYLRMKGVKCVIHSRMDRKTTQQAGVPDFVFAVNGRMVAIEAKTGSPVSEAQKARLAELEADGAIVGVVHTLAEVVDLFHKAEYEQDGPEE